VAVATVEIQVNGQGAVRNLRQISAESRNTENALDGLKRAAAGVAFVALGRQVVQAAASYKDLQLRLKLLSSQYGEYGRAQEFAAQSAKKFGLSNREAATGVADIYARLRPLGVSLKDIQSTYTGFNTVAKLSGVNAEGASAAFLQLGQALGSGRLQGDEFRSIGEQIPGLLVAISKETGIAAKDLKQFASDGKLSSDIVIRALKNIEVEGSGKIAALIQASDTQKFKDLSNAVDDLQISLGEQLLPIVLPLVQDLVSLTKAVAEIPEPIKKTTVDIVKLVVELVLLKKAFDAIIGIRAALLGTLGAVATTTAATGTAAKSSASAFALYTSNVKTLETAAAASTTRAAGLLGVLRSLGTIGGIIITIDLIVKGIGDVITATREIARLQNRRAGGGAAAQFEGASRETVVDAQKKQKDILAGIRRSQKANQLGPLQKGAQSLLGGLSPLLGIPSAGQQAQRAQLYNEQARFSQGVLGLNPEAFKKTAQPDLSTTTQSNATGGEKAKGGGSNAAENAAKKAAEEAAKEAERVAQVIRDRLAEGQILRVKSELQDKISAAEIDNDKMLAARLGGLQKEIDIQYQYAQALAQEKDVEAKKAIIFEGNSRLVANQRDVQRELGAIQRQREQEGLQAITAYLEKQYELNTAIQQQKALAESVSNTLGQGLTSVFDALIQGSDNWGKSLQQIASKVLVDIANQLIRIFVIEQAVSAIKSFLSPALPFGGGGGQIGGVGTLGPNYGIKQFANGGVPPVGRPSLVGERGPELFMPGVRGSVIPNNALGGGGTNVVVNVDASGSNVQGDQGQSRQLGVAISAAVQAELVKQQRPGGLLAGTRR
jgi:tape measure domain-containing protein